MRSRTIGILAAALALTVGCEVQEDSDESSDTGVASDTSGDTAAADTTESDTSAGDTTTGAKSSLSPDNWTDEVNCSALLVTEENATATGTIDLTIDGVQYGPWFGTTANWSCDSAGDESGRICNVSACTTETFMSNIAASWLGVTYDYDGSTVGDETSFGLQFGLDIGAGASHNNAPDGTVITASGLTGSASYTLNGHDFVVSWDVTP